MYSVLFHTCTTTSKIEYLNQKLYFLKIWFKYYDLVARSVERELENIVTMEVRFVLAVEHSSEDQFNQGKEICEKQL